MTFVYELLDLMNPRYRQRRALAAGFSIAKTREYTSIFLDLGHKVNTN
jgi:hypothetical protein